MATGGGVFVRSHHPPRHFCRFGPPRQLLISGNMCVMPEWRLDLTFLFIENGEQLVFSRLQDGNPRLHFFYVVLCFLNVRVLLGQDQAIITRSKE
jgi:hypothetical protein